MTDHRSSDASTIAALIEALKIARTYVETWEGDEGQAEDMAVIDAALARARSS